MGVGGGGEEKEEWSPPYAPQHTVKPLNKGCIGNNINSVFMSFVERLSSSQRFEMYWNHRETNSLLGPWKVPFVQRGLWSNVPILEGPVSDVYCNHNPSWWVWVPLVNSHISGERIGCPHHLFSGVPPSPTFAGNPGHQDCRREESCDNHITVTWSETIHFVTMLVTITLEPGSSFSWGYSPSDVTVLIGLKIMWLRTLVQGSHCPMRLRYWSDEEAVPGIEMSVSVCGCVCVWVCVTVCGCTVYVLCVGMWLCGCACVTVWQGRVYTH